MADTDSISVYRQFFEEFARTVEPKDPLPIRAASYSLAADEMMGEITESCIQYLTQKKCPRTLLFALIKMALDELKKELAKNPQRAYESLKVMQMCTSKINEICLRYCDNEKICSLPPPVEEPYFSYHAIKHTRRKMEDRLICLPRFHTLCNISGSTDMNYYALFDGHDGSDAASFAVSHLYQFLSESQYYPHDPISALHEAYAKTDSRCMSKKLKGGTTAVVILHNPVERKLIVSWLGDSLAMLVNRENYIMLVDPHKPDRSDELSRIEKLQGFVVNISGLCRVNGHLAVSRAIGDERYKPFVSAEPDIREIDLTGSEEFLVIGCDGLWDVVEPKAVIHAVYLHMKDNPDNFKTVSQKLVELAKEKNSTDNISVIVVFFSNPVEVSKRSVDATDPWPKSSNKKEIIMDADFQATEKSLAGHNEQVISRKYEENGRHTDFMDQLKDDSDEDFGPETDIDAVDDVLVSPTKCSNPFINDVWKKAACVCEPTSDLMEYRNQETMNTNIDFENLSDSNKQAKETNDKNSFDLSGPDATDIIQVNDMNSFILDPTIPDTQSFKSSNFSPTNKLMEDVKVFKEIENAFHSDNKTHSILVEKEKDYINENDPEEIETCKNDLTNNIIIASDDREEAEHGLGNDFMTNTQGLCNGNAEIRDNDKIDEEKAVSPPLVAEESFPHAVNPISDTEKTESQFENEVVSGPKDAPLELESACISDAENKFISEVENKTLQELENRSVQELENSFAEAGNDTINDTSMFTNKSNETIDLPSSDEPEGEVSYAFPVKNNVTSNFPTNLNEAISSDPQNDPKDAEPENFEICDSAANNSVLSAPQISSDSENASQKDTEIDTPDILSPVVPHAEEKIKDDIAESGGEVDSEDDEWDYYKVESRTTADEQIDLVTISPKVAETDESKMNSPLNPNAAEFVPVSPVGIAEVDVTKTPVRSIPRPIDDVIASSPNWNNMDHVDVPDEVSFLSEIKSRPSNIIGNDQRNAIDLVDLGCSDLNLQNNDIQLDVCQEQTSAESQLDNISPEIENGTASAQGIALAPDMTSSFIDPSTIGTVIETANQELELLHENNSEALPVQTTLNVSAPEFKSQLADLKCDAPSKLPDLLSPITMHEDVVGSKNDPTPIIFNDVPQVKSEAVLQSSEPLPPTQTSPEQEPKPVNQSIVSNMINDISDIPPTHLSNTLVEDENSKIPSDLAEPILEDSTQGHVSAAAKDEPAAEINTVAESTAEKGDHPKKESETSKTSPVKVLKSTTTKSPTSATRNIVTSKKPVTLQSTKSSTSTSSTRPISSNSRSATNIKPDVSKATSTAKSPLTAKMVSSTTTSRPIARKTTASSTLSKSPAAAKPLTSKPSTTSVRTTTTTATSRVTSTVPAAKPKPKTPPTAIEKKPSSQVESKTTVRRTELLTKKPAVLSSTITTTTRTVTARPTSAPSKPTTLKSTTTITATKTASTRPRTALTGVTATTTHTVTSTRTVLNSRKPLTVTDKLTKDMQTRPTSKTVVAKVNGVTNGKVTTTTTKTKMSSTISGNASPKTIIENKTDLKAENLIDNNALTFNNQTEKPTNEINKDKNLINGLNDD